MSDNTLAIITIIALMVAVVSFFMILVTGAFFFDVLGYVSALVFLGGMLRGIRINDLNKED